MYPGIAEELQFKRHKLCWTIGILEKTKRSSAFIRRSFHFKEEVRGQISFSFSASGEQLVIAESEGNRFFCLGSVSYSECYVYKSPLFMASWLYLDFRFPLFIFIFSPFDQNIPWKCRVESTFYLVLCLCRGWTRNSCKFFFLIFKLYKAKLKVALFVWCV